uniref:Uncharacterized protein n=1 Tax=Myotis myotis TaxID=51298 RepID=A0A7J7RMD7_MYOMY|nr:hypothetical protein mMyoMyo1_010281 [Myotis myotis]
MEPTCYLVGRQNSSSSPPSYPHPQGLVRLPSGGHSSSAGQTAARRRCPPPQLHCGHRSSWLPQLVGCSPCLQIWVLMSEDAFWGSRSYFHPVPIPTTGPRKHVAFWLLDKSKLSPSCLLLPPPPHPQLSSLTSSNAVNMGTGSQIAPLAPNPGTTRACLVLVLSFVVLNLLAL